MHILEWSAASSGIVSAAFWWATTWKSISTTQSASLSNGTGEDGDIALQTAPDMYVIYRWGRVARLNAIAAFLPV